MTADGTACLRGLLPNGRWPHRSRRAGKIDAKLAGEPGEISDYPLPSGIDIFQRTTWERSLMPHRDLLQRSSNPDRRQIGAIPRLRASAEVKAAAEMQVQQRSGQEPLALD
jgi:hypothetical protein